MLTEAVPGTPLHALAPEDAEVGAIAAIGALRALHALPIESCPFDARLAVRMAEAARRVAGDEVRLVSARSDGVTGKRLIARRWYAGQAEPPPDAIEDAGWTPGPP